MINEIPEWVRQLATPRTIDCFVCVDFHEARLVREWAEDQIKGLLCCILSVPLANCYLVLGLGGITKDGAANDATSTPAK